MLFTPLKSLRDLRKTEQIKRIQDAVSGAYLEGDVRIRFTPSEKPGGQPAAEQRLEANRVYYEFATDRAILTDAVVHTIEPKANIPFTVRAKTVRTARPGGVQRRQGAAEHQHLRRADVRDRAPEKIYVRQDRHRARGDRSGRRSAADRHARSARSASPIFYLPSLGGSISDEQTLLRCDRRRADAGVRVQGALTEFGLFETFG